MVDKDMATASNYYNHVASPSVDLNENQLASRSVPGSRRNSNDEKK
jgi:hypothetical protein